MLEKTIEKKLFDETKARGGIAFKFSPLGINGIPDRIVLLPKAKIGFVELKAPGKPLRELQKKRKRQIEALGFLVFKVDSVAQIRSVLDEIQGS